MAFQIGETGKSYIVRERSCLNYVSAVRSGKPDKQCALRIGQLHNDVLQIGNKSGNTVSEHVAGLEKIISDANTPDDFTIAGAEINKCSDAEKSYLIPKYIARFTSVKEKLYKNKQISPKNTFEEIFRKNFTKEEAEQLCSKYREILEEPDLRKYAEKLFVQIKKDFGLDYLPLELKINERQNIGITTNGGTSNCLDFMVLNYHKDNPLSRVGIFAILMHELNHAKQDEIAIATDYKAYTKAVAFRSRQNPQNSCYTQEELEKFIIDEIGTDTIANIRNKNGIIDEGSQLYKQGMTYIDNAKNYVEMKEFDAELFKKYKKQILEKESYDVQYKAEELYYYLTNKNK